MSCRELIESLRKAAGGRTLQIWKDAEAEADRIRQETACRRDTLRAEAAGRQAALVRDVIARSLSQAQNRIRILKLSAQQDLSGRLYRAALSRLPALRNSRYQTVFEKLVRELPPLDWKIVRVHPNDVQTARKQFPDAEIAADASISGGLDASTADEAVRIVNTFEKRLERAWDEIGPALVRDLWREVSDGTPSANAGPGIPGRIPAVQDQGAEVPADHKLDTADR